MNPTRFAFAAVATLVSFGVLTGQAQASSCPKHAAAIEKALKTTKVSADAKKQAQALLKDGQAKHKAGDHGGSMKALTEAEGILGIGKK